jgi:hypothetical protein
MAWSKVTLLQNPIIKFGNDFITDHNRSPLSIGIQRIENSKRTANGTLRKSFIADKHTFSLSWDEVPNTKTYTIDRGLGAGDIYDFYRNNTGPFNLTVTQTLDSPVITNVVGTGTIVTYTAPNTFRAGDVVKITGVSPSSYNLNNVTIATASPTQFTVNNAATGTYASGGIAQAVKVYSVMFSTCNYEIIQRDSNLILANISIELEEV